MPWKSSDSQFADALQLGMVCTKKGADLGIVFQEVERVFDRVEETIGNSGVVRRYPKGVFGYGD
ncbi:MAG: hypothetical protein ABSB42_17265 [Tepidisphaeraceae bacterium]|jgi:putative transposon-encoded protein